MSLPNTLNQWLGLVKVATLDAFGDEVVALIHHGSTVEQLGDQPVPNSDTIKLLLVLSKIDNERLESLACLPVDVTDRSQFEWIVLSESELGRSTDVLPDLFLEIGRRSEVIFGTNVLSDISIRHDHLRLRCEQQFKTLLIEMQQELMIGSNEMKQKLSIQYQTMVRIFGGALWLLGCTPPSDTEKLLDLAAEQFNFRRQTLREVLETIESKDLQRRKHIDAQISLLEIVRNTSVFVDEMDDEVITIDTSHN